MRGRFGLYISILGRSARSYFQKELAPYSLGPGQQAYLLAIFPGETVNQEEIVKRLKVDKANVARAVKGLQDIGYVKRIRDQHDRRIRQVSLTAKGTEIRKAVIDVSARWLEHLSTGISEEDWKRTEEILERIAASAVFTVKEF